MMNKITLLLFCLAFSIIACQSKDPNEMQKQEKKPTAVIEAPINSINDGVFNNTEIGWTIEIPEGWERIENKEEDPSDPQMNYVNIKSLISFRKGEYNLFQSTIEPFEMNYQGEWQENERALKYVIYQTYESQGIIIDTTVTVSEEIDGVHFHTYSFSISDKATKNVMEQIIYRAPIHGYEFGVVITSNNEEDKEDLLTAFRNSKFHNK